MISPLKSPIRFSPPVPGTPAFPPRCWPGSPPPSIFREKTHHKIGVKSTGEIPDFDDPPAKRFGVGRRARLLATAEVHQLGATREVQKNLDVAIVEVGKRHETQWAKP